MTSKRALDHACWLAAAIAAASCAPSFTTLRSEGSRLLACAEVKVVWVRDLDYDAKGCGRIVSMRCDKAACRALPPPPLSPDEMPDAPVFATKNAPPPSCVAMGAAEGNDDTWGTPKYALALHRLRRIAYDRGANYIMLDDTVRDPGPNGLFVGGRLFKCPKEAMTERAPSHEP